MRARSALVFALLRLLAFFVPFGIMMLFPVMREQYWLAAIFAALIGLSLSILFLRRPLDEMSVGMAERREARRRANSDEAVEDAFGDDETQTPR
ncbi:DUF4229 domain-containing protein [Microbacterium sp. EYE_5]|uniref:DUF4229 domain-containing protein n=1 Tax=unclassified Microbacterium TaxID=2609290 RepID=UPI00200321F3|nr:MULTISPECIES: DUF4229 domain-containing protein [unclassified Microbacterium]MCK6080170.1 DUF4229 domain-containing protein [Microbacterium sp. EYE_382]MCK6085441.1 DUF4229 domain-containing protein [Microbacterium sp. EYE_384]MCK6122334.1 DUF4229 domain-containing protein [Microbacterium sp. EYE_80]MCK6126204.1 DUF4229 domain-containing protein [Microbacterium sp. EYE_79]MCK6141125.1 DUF4229 domain-containing protein [Microbacterium sp. EYE_39]